MMILMVRSVVMTDVVLMATVVILAWVVPPAGGVTGETWAVELTKSDSETTRQVAGDLGMVVVGRVFENVVLMREIDESKNEEELTGEQQYQLNHKLIAWSEKQRGRRRTSGSKRTEKVNDVHDMEDSTRRENKMRKARDIGGLDRKPPKSPWEYLKTQDPLQWRQWYLGPGEGMSLNVTGLWETGVRGGGISIAILDDGVELTHMDLALNYDPRASWDLLDADSDPTPMPWSRHGTQMAGIIAATHQNGMCGMGVAPWTGVGAVRLLGSFVWDADEAAALSHERDHVDVYVAAWGPVDTGTVMEGPGVLASRAIREGIALGRNGNGSIYVWASGTGGLVGDDCNADGYANSVYTITVSGSTRGGRPPDYAETCAATFVSTYSGDADAEDEYEVEEPVNGVVTTDTGGICTESFRGSSVSAAMAAGACALALDVNPRLKWRDMQHLMVRAATPHNPIPTQWNINGIGLQYSHLFGFGSLNIGQMVHLAQKWQSVPPAFRCHMHAPHNNLTLVPDIPLVLVLSVSGCQVVQVEHVQVNISISVRSRGQVEIRLESPSGTVSTLLPQRPLDLSPYGIYNHPFLTVHMWGEDPRGDWKLHVTYHNSSIIGPFGSKHHINTTIMMHNWTLIIHGTEVALEHTTPYHYYYNSTQLTKMALYQGNHELSFVGIEKARNPRHQLENRIRIETQHWSFPSRVRGRIHSYLFCRVRIPSTRGVVSTITWLYADGRPIRDYVRRLSGKGPHSSRCPALLLVREGNSPEGNYTCRVVYNNKVITENMEIWGNRSSVPGATETTQVSVEGGTVRLSCDGLAPILRGTWIRDGQQLQPSQRFVMHEYGLTIHEVERGDIGVYKCVVKSPRLHYSHMAIITLLLAQGPSTLITHYAITSHPSSAPVVIPQLPTSCSQQKGNESHHFQESKNTTHCPPPYQMVQDHCLLVLLGAPKPWHQAREQCQRQGADLLIVADAVLMLALMQFLHSQG